MENNYIDNNPMGIVPDGYDINNSSANPIDISLKGGNDFMATFAPKPKKQYSLDISSDYFIPNFHSIAIGSYVKNKKDKTFLPSLDNPVENDGVNHADLVHGSTIGQREINEYGRFVNGRVNDEVDFREAAGQKQSSWETWGRGLGKFAVSAGQSFIEPFVDITYGIPAMAVTGEKELFYDNAVTRWMDDLAKSYNENNPVHYTRKEQEAALFSKDTLWSDNFWADRL